MAGISCLQYDVGRYTLLMNLSTAIRKRLGKCSAQEIEAEIRRMQKLYEEGGKFDFKVYGQLRKMLRNIDRIAVQNGGVARQDLHEFDEWVRRRSEKRAAAALCVGGVDSKLTRASYCRVVS